MDGDENGSLFSQPCNRSWRRNGLQQLAPRQLTLKGAPLPFQVGAKFIQNTDPGTKHDLVYPTPVNPYCCATQSISSVTRE